MICNINMIKSSGLLRYSPQLLGESSVNWWLVIDCDPEIGRLYRDLYRMERYNCSRLQRPSWKEHISVIRNEEPSAGAKFLWKKHDGEPIEFEYIPTVRDDGMYFWLPVYCERALDIRTELGLPRQPEYYLHLTVGNAQLVYNDQDS